MSETATRAESVDLPVPHDLVLGVSTSSHQVEGADDRSDWEAFERQPSRIRNGDDARRAVDYWNRFPEDVALMRANGIQLHRQSISWARVEPRPGEFDLQALDHYAAMFEAHESAGIAVGVTLLHFTLPEWLAQRGGILCDDAVALFGRYASVVARRLGPLVDQWYTINEPMVHADGAFRRGVWPPGRRSTLDFVRAVRALVRMHVAGARAVHDGTGGAAGIVQNLIAIRPERPASWPDRALADVTRWVLDDSLLEAMSTGRLVPPWGFGEEIDGLRGSSEFLGINYYNGATACASRWPPVREGDEGDRRTHMGWVEFAPGIGDVLRSGARLGLPMYITENGIGTEDDAWRAAFLKSHLREVVCARDAGIDVRGYFHWSWIDNFEWAEGYYPTFGLVGVAPDTLARIPKNSLAVYADIIRRRVISGGR